MRLGMSAGNMLFPWPFFDINATFEVAAEHNLGLEIFPRRGLSFETVLAKSQEFNVPIFGIHAAFWWDAEGYRAFASHIPHVSVLFSWPANQVIKRTLGDEAVARSRELAKQLAAGYVNYHPDVLVRARNHLQKPSSAVITVENDGGLIWPFAGTVKLAEKLNVKLTLDTSHTALERIDLMQVLELALPRLGNVHFSDGIPGKDLHGIPGQGTLELKAFLRQLVSAGFTAREDFCLIIELNPPIFSFSLPPLLNFRSIAHKIKPTLGFIRDIVG